MVRFGLRRAIGGVSGGSDDAGGAGDGVTTLGARVVRIHLRKAMGGVTGSAGASLGAGDATGETTGVTVGEGAGVTVGDDEGQTEVMMGAGWSTGSAGIAGGGSESTESGK